MGAKLHVGDRVIWRGGWGKQTPAEVVVVGIERTENGENDGEPVESMPWSNRRNMVVCLDNEHWAYGYQIDPVRES